VRVYYTEWGNLVKLVGGKYYYFGGLDVCDVDFVCGEVESLFVVVVGEFVELMDRVTYGDRHGCFDVYVSGFLGGVEYAVACNDIGVFVSRNRPFGWSDIGFVRWVDFVGVGGLL
jgi:hypothetical protein